MDDDFNLKVDLNENLGNYWKCISGIDQKRWFTKEIYLRSKLKIRTIDDMNLTLMGNTGRDEKCITNTCNYDILQNEKYADAFFYTQMERRTLKFLFESSDIVSKLIYLGEEKIVDIHNRGHEVSDDESSSNDEEFAIQSNDIDFMNLRQVQKATNLDHDLSTKDRLLGKLKGTFADIGEDLEADDFELNVD